MTAEITVREGAPEEATVLAECFRRMWLDIGVTPRSIESDYVARVERFVADGRAQQELRFFFAERAGEVVGSSCAQRFAGLYPNILKPDLRQYGYLWGVWVAEDARRQGLGRVLTERCLQALREAGCTHALLHAAPMGRPIYEKLGFEGTQEMRLAL